MEGMSVEEDNRVLEWEGGGGGVEDRVSVMRRMVEIVGDVRVRRVIVGLHKGM